MESGRVAAKGIELVYDAFGDPGGTPLLLIMGIGVPRFGWEDDFCQMLAERGFRVLRFDNRDVGESTHLADEPVDLWAIYAGDTSAAPYLLDDMADDAGGLLDALGIGSAHVVGASMGGMIAQAVAIHHPARVRSLTSIMSTVSPSIGAPREDVVPVLLTPPGRTREEHEEIAVHTWRVIGSPGFPLHEDRVRGLARRVWEVGHDSEGFKRQLAAIIASGDRTPELRELAVPALVIHGAADPLIQLPGGEATARAIPGAELEVIEGMGHDLPPELFAHFADRIAQLARRAEGARVQAA